MAGLRFCSLTTFYPPFNFGGDGIDVQRTARALAARGHHVTVIHDVDAYQWLSSHIWHHSSEDRGCGRLAARALALHLSDAD
jgi:hypothetical protein